MIKIYEKQFRAFLILIFLSSLSGCYEYDKNISDARDNKYKHPEQRIFDAEVEPYFPDDNSNNKTILGVDDNKNGVRDDIDVWINFVGKSRNHRMGLRELARAYSEMLVAGDKGDHGLIQKTSRNVYDANACTSFLERDKKLEERSAPKIVSLIFNTDIRIQSSEKYHSVSFVYKSNHKDMYVGNEFVACKFSIDNLQELIKEDKARGGGDL